MKVKMTLANVKHETSDTCTLTYESAQRPDFKPGQFFMIEFLRAEKLPKRSYSVSSSPTRKGILELTIKSMPEGWISKLLTQANVGEEFMLDGPWGHFVFDENKMQEIVMLGAGSGIAPFRCFLQYIEDKKLDTKASIYYCNKTESDIICKMDLIEAQKRCKNVSVNLMLTREEKEGYHCGRIDDAVVKKIISQSPQAYFFICGPPAMVTDTEKLLLENGVPKGRVKIEKYG